MPAAQKRQARAAPGTDAGTLSDALQQVTEAVESGAGLPAVTRAAGAALDASVIVLDSATSVVAVACASPEDERAVMAGEGAAERTELLVAQRNVGQMRWRPRTAPPETWLLKVVANLLAGEVDRARAPQRESEAAVGDFLGDLLGREVTDRENIVARAAELGADLGDGASVIVTRARPHQPEEGDWRARVLTVAERGIRGVERTSLAALVELGPLAERELVLVVPGEDADLVRRAADAVQRELELNLPNFGFVLGVSRPASDPADLHRAGAEALLAANVADARGLEAMAFEETGAYRLLLATMSDNPAELQRFYDETVAGLVAYDEQYETALVRTLEAFLDADGNVAKTAERLFTHRHTIRYRLDRVKELAGLDVGSTDGRERLSLGLKAMRVLGIVPPGGPALEAGTEAGRVPLEQKDR